MNKQVTLSFLYIIFLLIAVVFAGIYLWNTHTIQQDLADSGIALTESERKEYFTVANRYCWSSIISYIATIPLRLQLRKYETKPKEDGSRES